MKYKSYRRKLITIFILISVIPIVFIFIIANFNLRGKMIKEKTYRALIKALGITGIITLTLGGVMNQNKALIITGLTSSIIAQMLNIFKK